MIYRRISFFALSAFIFLGGLLSCGTLVASADGSFGREENETYYTGQESVGGWNFIGRDMFDASDTNFSYTGLQPWDDIENGVPIDVDYFIDEFTARLNSAHTYNKSRASAIINMMLGIDGNSPTFDGPSSDRWRNGYESVRPGTVNFNKWEQIVRYYNDPNGDGDLSDAMVNFNDYFTESDPYDWLGAEAPDRSVLYNDVVRERMDEEYTNTPAIIFYNADGTQFALLKECANAVGDISPLYIPGPPPVPALFSVSAEDGLYEKGSNINPTITYKLIAESVPADVTVTWSGDGAAANFTTVVAAGTTGVVETQAVEIPYGLPNNFNSKPVGPFGLYKANIISPMVGSSNVASVKISEAPFARFFGSDVLVCGGGSDNRFIYDNRSAPPPPTNTGNPLRGSFSEYATIYASGNNPIANSFLGLRTLTKNTGSVDTRLAANWSTLSIACGNLPTDEEIGTRTPISTIGTTAISAGDNSITYVSSGDTDATDDIYISGQITRDPSMTFTDIYDYPVVVIRAKDNIYIKKDVTNIEAVLIAGGSIYTCADDTSGTVTPVLQNQWDEQCNQPLKITGAAMAGERIVLQRAKGTRYLANTDPNNWKNTTATNSTAAEIIEFPHYLNFVKSYDLTSRSAGGYQSYRSLPPRL